MADIAINLKERRSLAGLFGHPLRTLANTIDRNRRYRRALEELDRLTDREVADLGVDRSHFPGIARASAGWS